ncbi:nuclease-related domain-containing protein [Nocardioides dilutus]
MGDKYAMDRSRHRRPVPPRLPLVGDADARRVEAQLRTTHALDELDPNVWTVIKDLEWPGGRYGHVDHVVVGPSGVYVIETKPWSGDVSVYGERLRYEGTTQDSVVASLTEAAAAVALLTPGVPQRLVKPVLCVAGAEGLDAQVDGLLVVSTDNLAAVLESRVHSMSTHQITIASGQLHHHLQDRGLVKVAARAGHREVKQANRRDSRPMRGVPVIRIAIAVWFAATLILSPHAFADTFETIQNTIEEKIVNR